MFLFFLQVGIIHTNGDVGNKAPQNQPRIVCKPPLNHPRELKGIWLFFYIMQ